MSKAFDLIRELLLLRRWKQNLHQSFLDYILKEHGLDWQNHLKEEGELRKDLQAGRDALDWAMKATWWGWDAGSALFFWRWPDAFRKEARDGTPVHVSGTLPVY